MTPYATFDAAITALATKLGCADDADTVADALRTYAADLEVARNEPARIFAVLVESHIRARAGAETQVAFRAPDLIALLP